MPDLAGIAGPEAPGASSGSPITSNQRPCGLCHSLPPLRPPVSRRSLAVGAAPASARVLEVAPNGRTPPPRTRSAPLATITRALALASPATTVRLAAGDYYASISDQQARTGAKILVTPAPGAAVTVGNVWLLGAQGIILDGLTVRGHLVVNNHWSRLYDQRAERIELRNLDISSRAGGNTQDQPCVVIRGGARSISLRDSYVHSTARSACGQPGRSALRAHRDRAQHLPRVRARWHADRGLDDVLIRRNVIEDLSSGGSPPAYGCDPADGNMSGLRIESNVLRNSSGQVSALHAGRRPDRARRRAQQPHGGRECRRRAGARRARPALLQQHGPSGGAAARCSSPRPTTEAASSRPMP